MMNFVLMIGVILMELSVRPTQTKVKHEILNEYIKRWGYIITSGLKGLYITKPNLVSKFVYVDCFSFRGKYQEEDNNPVYGSPVIGIRALDSLSENFSKVNGTTPQTFTILIEENKRYYSQLKETLKEVNLYHRVKENASLSHLKSGEIALYNTDCNKIIDQLISFTSQPFTWSLYLLDPFGPSGIPLQNVSKVMKQEKADVIINFPYLSIHRTTGLAIKEEPSSINIATMENYDEMFGSEKWKNITNDIKTLKEVSFTITLERELVDLYYDILKEQDDEVAVKYIPLKFPDKERTMYYLFLTTHDGSGALTMNEILDDAKISEYDQREKERYKKVQIKKQQTSLFDIESLDNPNKPNFQSDPEVVAQYLEAIFAGRSLTLKSLYKEIADSPYYLEVVKAALRLLKRQRKCSFTDLKNREVIEFFP